MIIECYILTFIYIFFVLIISEILKSKKIISEEIARKIVHIFVSFAYLIMYNMMDINIHIVLIPLIFVVINYISYKKNIFKGMEISSRKSLGTIYYPISMVIMAIITLYDNKFYPYYGIGLFTMAFADGLAPIVASKIKSKNIGKSHKSISGSTTVFVVTIIILLIFSNIFNLEFSLLKIIVISIFSTIIECISDKYDNIFLPIGISLLSYLI
ncbi:MAG: hypothetical protein ACI4OT_05580 [Bacilli bacterium]